MGQAPLFDRDELVASLRRDGVHVPSSAQVGWFGNTPDLASRLGELVRSGVKTATASLLWAWEAEDAPAPRAGDVEIVVDWAGRYLALIETTHARIVPFRDVEAAFAHDEGEGDRSLDHWRRVHWLYFSAECRALGLRPTEDMPVVCQRFRLVHASPRASGSPNQAS
jgi:uncharacterized protein YhfF